MSDLNQALVDIRAIRRQMAEATEFRGYGPLTLFGTAAAALAAGGAQAYWVPDPANHPAQYVALWLATGIFSAGLIAMQMLTRANRLHSGMADEMIRMAVAQFLPRGDCGGDSSIALASCSAGGDVDAARAVADCVRTRGVCLVQMPAACDVSGRRWFLFTGLVLRFGGRCARSGAGSDGGSVWLGHGDGCGYPSLFPKEGTDR